MAAKRVMVSYFVEDVGHESFLEAAVKRAGKEENTSIGYASRILCHGNKVLEEFRTFLRDTYYLPSLSTDLLIVAVDGNAKGYSARVKEIQQDIQQFGYAKTVVCMVPDPHVERWYLCDPQALRQALSSSIKPRSLPKKRYQRDWYKAEYQRLLKEAEIHPLVHDYEHAETIVEHMNLYEAGKKEPSLRQFLDDLRSALRNLAQQS